MATRKPSKAKRTTGVRRAAQKKTRPGTKTAARATKAASRSASAVTRDRRSQEPETLRLRSVEPSFTVDDLDRSLRFYTEVCGFIVGDRWEGGGVLRGVTLKAGVCELNLSQDDWAKGRDRKKGEGLRIYCQTVQEIDALAARIKAAGGRLTEEPKDQPWGSRSLSVDDPDGFHLTIYKMR
jgi:lactoylglutathione lyase